MNQQSNKITMQVTPQEQHLLETIREIGWGSLVVTIKHNGVPTMVEKPIQDIRLREKPKEGSGCQVYSGRSNDKRTSLNGNGPGQ